MGHNLWKYISTLKPIFLMVLVQISFAGVNILYKLAGNDGMNLRILITYRFIFASAFICPVAYIAERNTKTKLTWTVVGQAFLCGLFGGSLSQNLCLESIMLTSASYASAIGILFPAITFILSIVFRLENLSLNTRAGQAKILGTVIGIAGAMLLTFYKGLEIKVTSINLHKSIRIRPHGHNNIMGSLIALGGCFSYACWFIVQAKMSKKYTHFYSSTALMCVMAAIQSGVAALCLERDWTAWTLGWNVRLLAVAFSGIVASGVMATVIAWCIRLRGPVFVSVFSPLMLIVVTVVGSLLLNEKLYLGSVLGGFAIVLGLYVVIWGKGKELENLATSDEVV